MRATNQAHKTSNKLRDLSFANIAWNNEQVYKRLLRKQNRKIKMKMKT